MRTLDYRICDVFTDRVLAGNALAVFTDPGDLDGATMQALAREMNLSETTFVLPPTVASAHARIRIFTPTTELPFAGHPTLGTAFVLAASIPDDVIRLEMERGIVPVRLSREGASVRFGWMTQPSLRYQAYSSAEEAMAALGVRRSGLPIDLYDNGPQYVFLEVETAEAVEALHPDLGRLGALGKVAFSVFARRQDRWKCRVFAPGGGVPEDPATGSAAGALALHLARHARIRFGDEIVIEQGAEVGRPSTIHARAIGTAEHIQAVEAGGSAVIIGGGQLRI